MPEQGSMSSENAAVHLKLPEKMRTNHRTTKQTKQIDCQHSNNSRCTVAIEPAICIPIVAMALALMLPSCPESSACAILCCATRVLPRKVNSDKLEEVLGIHPGVELVTVELALVPGTLDHGVIGTAVGPTKYLGGHVVAIEDRGPARVEPDAATWRIHEPHADELLAPIAAQVPHFNPLVIAGEAPPASQLLQYPETLLVTPSPGQVAPHQVASVVLLLAIVLGLHCVATDACCFPRLPVEEPKIAGANRVTRAGYLAIHRFEIAGPLGTQ